MKDTSREKALKNINAFKELLEHPIWDTLEENNVKTDISRRIKDVQTTERVYNEALRELIEEHPSLGVSVKVIDRSFSRSAGNSVKIKTSIIKNIL